MIHDRLLRAARVAVAKRRSNESPSPGDGIYRIPAARIRLSHDAGASTIW
jgi:hypothetical protein